MNYAPSVIRMTLERTRAYIAASPSASLHGALFFITQQIEQDTDNASALYAAVRSFVDHSERLALIDAALARLERP